jgi:hypothetical protein
MRYGEVKSAQDRPLGIPAKPASKGASAAIALARRVSKLERLAAAAYALATTK